MPSSLVYANDYPNNLPAAVAATPVGGTLVLPPGPYQHWGQIWRDDITIQGQGMPRLAPLKDRLLGGSIIQGTLDIRGSGVRIKDFGVDAGEYVMANIWATNPYGAVDADAISFTGANQAGDAIREYNSAHNIMGLCRNPAAPRHGFVAAGQRFFTADNIHGINGWWPVVFKVMRSNASKLTAQDGGKGGVTLKSDSQYPGGPPNIGHDCFESNFSDITVLDDNYNTPYAVFIYAATGDLYDVNVDDVTIKGTQYGLTLVGDVRATWNNTLRRVNVSNVSVENPSQRGMHTWGGLDECTVDDITVYGAPALNGIFIQPDCKGLHLNHAIYSTTLATPGADAISLGGVVFADDITCIKNGDYSQKAGIKRYIDPIGGRLINAWGNVT